MQYAQRTQDNALKAIAIDMIDWSFDIGWDSKEHGGGILYFLDSEGRNPPYLEWHMKLWWPHNEAMIAFAMLYKETKDIKHWQKFVQVCEYAFAHFSDATHHGEWFGYCDRDGTVTHRFKVS